MGNRVIYKKKAVKSIIALLGACLDYAIMTNDEQYIQQNLNDLIDWHLKLRG